VDPLPRKPRSAPRRACDSFCLLDQAERRHQAKLEYRRPRRRARRACRPRGGKKTGCQGESPLAPAGHLGCLSRWPVEDTAFGPEHGSGPERTLPPIAPTPSLSAPSALRLVTPRLMRRAGRDLLSSRSRTRRDESPSASSPETRVTMPRAARGWPDTSLEGGCDSRAPPAVLELRTGIAHENAPAGVRAEETCGRCEVGPSATPGRGPDAVLDRQTVLKATLDKQPR